MEIEMKSRYSKISGRLVENNDGNTDDTETDDSDSEDVEAYGGFSGACDLPQITNVTEV